MSPVFQTNIYHMNKCQNINIVNPVRNKLDYKNNTKISDYSDKRTYLVSHQCAPSCPTCSSTTLRAPVATTVIVLYTHQTIILP